MDLHKVKFRAGLKVQREPYWTRIRGGHLGFRKTVSGSDSWIVKTPGRQRQVHRIGLLSELSYDEAVNEAQNWLDERRTGISGGGTVEAALKAYVEHLKVEKSESRAKDARQKFRSTVYDTDFGRTELPEVTRQQVINFRNELLTEKRGKSAANRIFRVVKAGLSEAHINGWGGAAPWKTVQTFDVEDQELARDIYLTKAELRRLFKAMNRDLRDYCEATLYTYSRAGDMAGVTCKHFNANTGTVRLKTLKGKSGQVIYRSVALSSAALAIFKRRAKGKIGNALLFTHHGLTWNKTERAREFKKAVIKAKLPGATVITTLRHTAISTALSSGQPASRVAAWSGTSTKMIEQNYAQFLCEDERKEIESVSLL